jgi:predicted Zn-dependent protease
MKNLKTFLFGEKDTLSKRIVNYSLIFLVIAGFTEYGIDHNGDMSGLMKKETWESNKAPTIVDDTVYIMSLGEVNKSILNKASNIISKKFNVNTKIVESIDYTEDLFHTDFDKINPYYSVEKFNDGSGRKRIVITETEMTDDDGITSVMGICCGNTMLVSTISPFKETLIHEYGHSLGLNHCPNPKCIMSTFGNGYEVSFGSNFCENCEKKYKL